MHRRDFVRAGVAATALGVAPRISDAQQVSDRHVYELRFYEMRSDMAPNRIRPFFRDHMIPALQRAGAGPVGLFAPDVGLSAQTIVLSVDYRSASDAIAVRERVEADATYADARRAFEGDGPAPYLHYESRLLRAFAGHPQTEIPAGDASRAPRVFELRTYESRNTDTLARKIEMFNSAEIAIFRSIGMTPVFFGESTFAPRMPSLTYMLCFDDLAARATAWREFGQNPDWKRISTDPRYAIDGITTTTASVLLNPVAGSQLR